MTESIKNEAHRLVDRLTRRSQQIARFPKSGRMVPELEREDTREVIETPYRIVYRILDDRIDVLSAIVRGRYGSE